MQRTCRHQSFPTPLTTLTFSGILGSLYNDDGDGYGYENVTYKVNLRCLKLDRTYSISLNSSNVGKVFCSWILKDCIKVQERKRRCCFLFPSSTKREIRQFRVVVVQRRQRNVQKNVMHVQSCCSFAVLFTAAVVVILVSIESNISGVLLSAKYLFDKVTVA